MKRVLGYIGGFVAVVALGYFLGPKADNYKGEAIITDAIVQEVEEHDDVQKWIASIEETKPIRDGNKSQFYWADSTRARTKYVLLYLHGFSASPEEGAPIHQSIADRFGMNMYAPLLNGHGLEEQEPMLNFTADGWINSAKEALAVASQMGDSVIIMSTSTGCTAALFLASELSKGIHSLICYSPNIRVHDSRASLLTGPWGLEIARLVKGGDYHTWEAPDGAEQYWHLKYRIEALVEMQRLLEGTMTREVFAQIECPVYVGYYPDDDVVSVPYIKEMFAHLGSTDKVLVANPSAGAHCMPSRFFGKSIPDLINTTELFLQKKITLEVK